MPERLGNGDFKGAHACLETQEASIDRLEPLMDFGPEPLELLIHQEHALGHQLDPGLQILRNDIEVATGVRIARPHLGPQLFEAPIHLGEAAVHRFEAPVQIGDEFRVHARTLPPRRGLVKCLVDETRLRRRRSSGRAR